MFCVSVLLQMFRQSPVSVRVFSQTLTFNQQQQEENVGSGYQAMYRCELVYVLVSLFGTYFAVTTASHQICVSGLHSVVIRHSQKNAKVQLHFHTISLNLSCTVWWYRIYTD